MLLHHLTAVNSGRAGRCAVVEATSASLQPTERAVAWPGGAEGIGVERPSDTGPFRWLAGLTGRA